MKAKVKGENIKQFNVEIKQLTLDERAEINDMIIDTEMSKNFSFWLKIIRIGTDWTDEEINNYSTDEIIAIAGCIIEETNKKKLKK
tara:strand:- start:8053 stop:8310 length:258 start_codon:yes stop_codon:yes gene_type:complete